MKPTIKLWHLAAATMLAAPGAVPASTAGEAGAQPPQLREQEVHVTVQTGYVRTEVVQTLYNPNAGAVEAALHVPVPAEAALAEVEVGDEFRTLGGEVMTPGEGPRRAVPASFEGEAAAGARRIENGDLEIRIARLRPRSETRVRWVYYAPHALQRGEGRLAYPADGLAELPGREIWKPETELQGTFRLTVDLRYPSPIRRIATPGFEGEVQIARTAEDRMRVTLEAEPGEMSDDAVLTWEVEQPETGAVELIVHRPDRDTPGVFMMVFTPPAEFRLEPEAGAAPVLHFPGGRVSETSSLDVDALERGEQRVVFGRYNEGGRNRVALNEGGGPESVRFDTIALFPTSDDETPELERLWAQSRIQWLRAMADEGRYDALAAGKEIMRLAAEHQFLTRSNRMVLLDETGFADAGVARRNALRVANERKAQALRSGLPVWRTRADLSDGFFTPRGRREGGCCLVDTAGEAATPYGIDLNAHPSAEQMASEGLRYW